ncbi:unnamed protein product [Rotaria sordida]|uniref:N-acylglucosamine 2-epimerase n=1 Tax=Rotaria sordida TaxID=392033 RepID=A0A815E2L1_9BILA|nr:unnamed protein product [Rotaria sordida]CAF1577396.1 unnamed protein product [Rotaria sordida]
MKYGRDEENGGLIYGYDLEGNLYDDDKYFWVQCESLATTALLGDKLNDEKYWRRILASTNEKYSDEKSPTGKTDYHTMGVFAMKYSMLFIKNNSREFLFDKI